MSLSPIASYASRLTSALTDAGVPALHAKDAAANLAFPLSVDQDLLVEPCFVHRLKHQRRYFGLVMTDEQIAVAADAAAKVERPEGA